MTAEEVVNEVKHEYYVPFFELAKLLVDGLCERLNTNPVSDEMFDLKWEYSKVLKHEYEIRPIMEDCQKILGMR